MTYKEMIGKQFGSLQVIRKASKKETPWRSHSTPLVCTCIECNITSIIRKEDVEKGCVQCKINRGELQGGRGHKSISPGDRFGKLVAIEYETKQTIQGKSISYVKCKCDCGNIVSIRKDHLTGYQKGKGEIGHTISCGCSQESAGELYIKTMLDQIGVKFKPQYKIPELSSFMKFDFAVFDKNNNLSFLIEYDGIQHFKAVDCFGGEEKLKIQQERDQRKNWYCKNKGIPLIRIPYSEKLSNIGAIDLFPSSRFEI